MAVTTPRTPTVPTPPTGEGPGYGSLDRQPGRPGGATRVLLAVLGVAAVLGIVWWLAGRSTTDEAGTTTTVSTTQPAPSGSSTAGTSPSTTETSARSSATEPPAGWSIGGDLIDYVTEPIYSTPGSPEAAVEIAYVNSGIATARALANPGNEEAELVYWQTGKTLAGTRDGMRLLADKSQTVVTGPLTRLEVEKITFLSDPEADLEYCALLHDYNVVVDGSAPAQESLSTFQAVGRFVRASDGHWQFSENVRTIQDVDGIGSCLDVTVERDAPGD